MKFPIAYREMLVASRSPTLYRGRIIASVVLLLIGIAFSVVYSYTGAAGAMPVLGILGFILLQICLLSGAQATADSLSKEKREGTIGLLFLTPLKAWEITIGKLIAHGLLMFYGIIICLPLLSLGIIAGGVMLGDVFHIGLLAINTLFLSLSIGMYASSQTDDRRKAARNAIWIVMFFWLGIPALVGLAQSYKLPQIVITALSMVSLGIPATFMMRGPVTPMITAPGGLGRWIPFIATHLLGWMFIGLAIYNLKHRWQDHPPKQKLNLKLRWKNFLYGQGETRSAHRRSLLNRNAFLWLASRNRFAPLHAWIIILVLGAVLYFLLARHLGVAAGLSIIAIVLSLAQRLGVGTAAGAQLGIEYEQGTLEMILSTPITTREIIRGQFLALWRNARGPILLVWLLQGLATAALLFDPSAQSGLWLAMLAYTLLYPLTLWTMAWIGMWSVTLVKEPKKAAGHAMMRGVLLPAYFLGFIAAGFGFLHWLLDLQWEPDAWMVLTLWFLLALSNDLFWLWWIRKRLPAKIRNYSFQKYTPEEKKSFFSILRPPLPTRPLPLRTRSS